MLTSWSGLLHPTENTVAIVESTWHGIGIMPIKGPPHEASDNATSRALDEWGSRLTRLTESDVEVRDA